MDILIGGIIGGVLGAIAAVNVVIFSGIAWLRGHDLRRVSAKQLAGIVTVGILAGVQLLESG